MNIEQELAEIDGACCEVKTPATLEGDELQEWLAYVRWWRDRGTRAGLGAEGWETLGDKIEARFQFRTAVGSGHPPSKDTLMRWLEKPHWRNMLDE